MCESVLDGVIHQMVQHIAVGERSRKQKFPNYEHAQEHYEDANKVLIWSLPTRSVAEVESVKIIGADPCS